MIPLRVHEIAAAVGGRTVGIDAADVIDEVSTDSRAVVVGALFVALRGDQHDGHDHAAAAMEAGARVCLVEREIAQVPCIVVDDTWAAVAALAKAVRERVAPTVVAITGSVGKTTTKDLTSAAVSAGRVTTASRRSHNNELGVPLTVLSMTSDTQVLVAEVGSRGIGHIASLVDVLRPDVAVVTAVAPAHLQGFVDIETVARAKAELVEGLRSDGTAILNADDRRVVAMAERAPGATLTYGVHRQRHEGDVDVAAFDVQLDRLARPSFRARTPWGEVEVTLPVAGAHNVSNGLAALAVAGLIGVDIAAAAAALAAAPISGWRGEVQEVAGVVVINDAYNANPASVEAALKALVHVTRGGGRSDSSGVGGSHERGRSWAVLGVMAELGDASREAHERIGRLCVRLGIDRLIVVGPDAWPTREGADLEGFFGTDRWHVDTAEEASAILIDRVEPADAVLVKGSRVAGLERVAQALVAHLGAAA